MARNTSTWDAGKSGNPKGRPKKGRALTDLLERTGAKRIDVGGKTMPAKRYFAEKVWEGLTTGMISFEGGYQLGLDASEFIQLARMVLQQIDGAPQQAVDVTSEGNAVQAITLIEVVKNYESDV